MTALNVEMIGSFCLPCLFEVSSVVEWLKHRAYDQHGLGSKPLRPFGCVLGKDTLRYFPLLSGLGKQF